jgi:hypothetical protein
MIVDSKKLYNRFLDMVDKKQINIIHQSQAKKDQVGPTTHIPGRSQVQTGEEN